MKRNWQKELDAAVGRDMRVKLAEDKDCPAWLNQMFIEHDIEPLVVLTAAMHPRAGPGLKRRAMTRLQELEGEKNLIGDRDQILLSQLFESDKDRMGHAELHLGDNRIVNPAVRTKPYPEYEGQDSKGLVSFVICPSWGNIFPPYNLARLSATLRADNWTVDVYDINIESYHFLINETGNDYWRSERYYYWLSEFNTLLLPTLKPLLDARIKQIVESNPRVIGFTLYNTNFYCSLYMMHELRRLLPDVVIITGGPEWTSSNLAKDGTINYTFIGEAEVTLIEAINSYLFDRPLPNRKPVGDNESKIELNSLAFPDYSDYNLFDYKHPDGVSIETSRGCVAECSFCTETYYWKFRSRTPDRVIDEMKDQISKYGINRFWFVDSLVNGNLKNFEKLVDMIIEEKLDIRWNSYARCDGRMTKKFLKKVAESGCTSLSFGVESGSEKVLWDMRKKISVWEIEANLQHAWEAGMKTHVNWMVGFPTEEAIDFVHSLQLVFNTRKYIHAISPGMGAGDAPLSDMQTNWKTYDLQWIEKPGDNKFLGQWWTKDYKNTQLHRFVRIKLMAIWLKLAAEYGDSTMFVGQLYSNLKNFYTFERKYQAYVPRRNAQIPNIDFNQCKPVDESNQKKFSASIANEFVAFAWVLWKNYGAHKTTVRFNPREDFAEFGTYISQNYTADVTLTTELDGSYSIEVNHSFDHDTLNQDPSWKNHFEWERKREDMSFADIFNLSGKFVDWQTDKSMVGEIIHPAYRSKAKMIPIVLQK